MSKTFAIFQKSGRTGITLRLEESPYDRQTAMLIARRYRNRETIRLSGDTIYVRRIAIAKEKPA